MVGYVIHTEKSKFGDNRIEEALGKFGLQLKRIKTGPNETLIYEMERPEKLYTTQGIQILSIEGVHEVFEEI